MTTLNVEYTFRLATDRVETFEIQLDAESLELVSPPTSEPPPWTALEFKQCPHCMLDASTNPHCPLALSISCIVKRFDDVISYDEVDVEVTTPQRHITKHTSSQAALCSLMGLVIACSGCPHAAFFRPMARFHLPFASEEETASRAVSAWLVAQYYLHHDGRKGALDLSGLRDVYKNMQIVNRSIARRVRAASPTDAPVNAVVLLDMYAQFVPHSIRLALEEIRGPYEAFLSQCGKPSG